MTVWLFEASSASKRAVELRREVAAVGGQRPGRRQILYGIVWDTEHGYVVYLQPLDQTIAHRDQLAVHAGELIEPGRWSTAAVVMPLEDPAGATGEPPGAALRLRLPARRHPGPP